jgi:hypothetical protein
MILLPWRNGNFNESSGPIAWDSIDEIKTGHLAKRSSLRLFCRDNKRGLMTFETVEAPTVFRLLLANCVVFSLPLTTETSAGHS